jgi:hypothetical protein
LDTLSQRAEIAHTLDFIVRQLDSEVIFETRKKFERLEAVNAELFEKIVGWRERTGGHIEMLTGKIDDFLCGLVESAHAFMNLSFSSKEEKLPLLF